MVLGLAQVAIVCLGAPFSIWMVGSSEITWSYFPIGVGVPFLLIVIFNALLRRLAPSWRLTPAELIAVLSMGLVVSGIPIFMVGYLLAVISKPYYGATPENDWVGYVQPHLPEWAIPKPDGEALRYFYEGLPSGNAIPWGTWIEPLAWWVSLILALYLACFCLVVILRRQWAEHERLAFPLTEVPRMLLEESGDQWLPAICRSRAFWIGCAVPLTVILFNTISYFQPGFPQIGIHQDHPVQLIRGFPTLNFILYIPVVGFMYLVGTEISFSIWFFYLLTLLETGIVSWAGITVRPDAFVWGSMTTLSWQASGAFVAMVVVSLWMGRHHLRAVARKAIKGDAAVDDRGEMLSYRLAFFALCASLLYILLWLWRSGLAPHLALLYMAGVLVIYLGITRLVIQSGVYYLSTPLSSQALTLAVAGSAIAPHNLVALSLTYAWCGDIQSLFMPSAAHAAHLNQMSSQPRRLGVALALAVVVGIGLTVYFMIYLCYQYGAGNFRSWIYQPGAGAGGIAFDAVVRHIQNPLPTDWTKLSLFGIGAGLYSLLSVFQYRFHWWPLHPVGLTVATLWMVQRIALSVFLAWALKTLTLRFGGIGLYRQLRPFFIGLIVGFFLGIGCSYAIDAIWFFGKGHAILHG